MFRASTENRGRRPRRRRRRAHDVAAVRARERIGPSRSRLGRDPTACSFLSTSLAFGARLDEGSAEVEDAACRTLSLRFPEVGSTLVERVSHRQRAKATGAAKRQTR